MLKVICDVNISKSMVEKIRSLGYVVLRIADVNNTMLDSEIIDFAEKEKAMIITEDKDFGDLLFKSNLKILKPVVLIRRYSKDDITYVFEKLKNILAKIADGDYENFIIVLNKDQIRFRKAL